MVGLYKVSSLGCHWHSRSVVRWVNISWSPWSGWMLSYRSEWWSWWWWWRHEWKWIISSCSWSKCVKRGGGARWIRFYKMLVHLWYVEINLARRKKFEKHNANIFSPMFESSQFEFQELLKGQFKPDASQIWPFSQPPTHHIERVQVAGIVIRFCHRLSWVVGQVGWGACLWSWL